MKAGQPDPPRPSSCVLLSVWPAPKMGRSSRSRSRGHISRDVLGPPIYSPTRRRAAGRTSARHGRTDSPTTSISSLRSSCSFFSSAGVLRTCFLVLPRGDGHLNRPPEPSGSRGAVGGFISSTTVLRLPRPSIRSLVALPVDFIESSVRPFVRSFSCLHRLATRARTPGESAGVWVEDRSGRELLVLSPTIVERFSWRSSAERTSRPSHCTQHTTGLEHSFLRFYRRLIPDFF